MKIKSTIVSIILIAIISLPVFAQNKLELTTQPEETGKQIIDNIVERRFGWRYQKVCTYYGALIFADATANKNITQQIDLYEY